MINVPEPPIGFYTNGPMATPEYLNDVFGCYPAIYVSFAQPSHENFPFFVRQGLQYNQPLRFLSDNKYWAFQLWPRNSHANFTKPENNGR